MANEPVRFFQQEHPGFGHPGPSERSIFVESYDGEQCVIVTVEYTSRRYSIELDPIEAEALAASLIRAAATDGDWRS